MTAWRQLVEIARKDLRLEARSGEALLVTTPFGAVALLFVPLAVGTDTPLLRGIGPGLYWVVVLLFGLLVTLRTSAVDTPPQIALLRLCGVHSVVRLAGRAAASALLLLAFELLLVPVAVALYDPAPHGWPWLLVVLPLVAAGLGLLGTLAGALAQGLDGRTTLGPVLVLPLAVPLLLGATQAPAAAALGHAPWPWLLLMLTVDLIAALALLLGAPHLEEVA
ncbi:heme exporter protein B [Lentzea albidocapillata subsp. violacea]|uniref:Heme exporter protein B n=1 Tax=Lentzea albidocapillata subsp. violacea TaxID=128104 RepID=A0A1G9S1T6_9PSEU|nr:heme exporter protein CcmB [Lentzea albidocapillata]SDM29384.1 heme exporter protein B [Lentzea albidocapillata subsp. violacea]